MLEKIITNVLQAMSHSLEKEQLEQLQNVLYINFHGKKIVEDKCEIIPLGTDSDVRKMQLFRASKLVSGRQESTLKQYLREIMTCRNTINKSFEDITTMDLRWYFGILRERDKISMRTLQGRRRYLNSFWTFLEQEGLVKNNPVERIEAFKLENKLKKAFSGKEMTDLRAACKDVRETAIVEFLYATGLRVSELCSLNVRDIDMQKQEFRVIGKGRKERIVYIHDNALRWLEKYYLWRMEKEDLTLSQLGDKPLFVTAKKPFQRLTVAGVQYLLKQIGKRANVENVHPHRFRRTFATDLLNRGMRIEEVMVLMGHSKVETTLIYCNIRQDNIRESYRRYAA